MRDEQKQPQSHGTKCSLEMYGLFRNQMRIADQGNSGRSWGIRLFSLPDAVCTNASSGTQRKQNGRKVPVHRVVNVKVVCGEREKR
jgi:hypothetical protein